MNFYNQNPYVSYPYGGIQSPSPYGYSSGNMSGMNYPQQNVNIQQQQQQILNGKIVDSKDVVKVTEVPLGSYGVFPKADFSEIYVKLWNNDGTTSLVEFKPVLQEQTEKIESEEHKLLTALMGKINDLEIKIDNIVADNKGVKANEY